MHVRLGTARLGALGRALEPGHSNAGYSEAGSSNAGHSKAGRSRPPLLPAIGNAPFRHRNGPGQGSTLEHAARKGGQCCHCRSDAERGQCRHCWSDWACAPSVCALATGRHERVRQRAHIRMHTHTHTHTHTHEILQVAHTGTCVRSALNACAANMLSKRHATGTSGEPRRPGAVAKLMLDLRPAALSRVERMSVWLRWCMWRPTATCGAHVCHPCRQHGLSRTCLCACPAPLFCSRPHDKVASLFLTDGYFGRFVVTMVTIPAAAESLTGQLHTGSSHLQPAE